MLTSNDWQRIYLRYYSLWKAVCNKYCQDNFEHDDIIHHVVLKIIEKERAGEFEYKSDSLTSSYIATSIRNFISNLHKTKKPLSLDEINRELLIDNNSPIEQLIKNEDDQLKLALKQKLIHSFKTNLKDYERELIYLRFIEEKTYREISEITGSPIPRIQKRLTLALRKISKKIRYKK